MHDPAHHPTHSRQPPDWQDALAALVPHEQDVRRSLLRAFIVLVAVVISGTIGYAVLERWSLWDAFFMTIITITTVGYGEVRPLDRSGEVFTVVLLIAGVGSGLYTLNVLVRMTMEGELTGALAERQMRQRIEHMQNHIILCGYGRVGEEIARTLQARKEQFVMVELDRRAPTRAEEVGYDDVQVIVLGCVEDLDRINTRGRPSDGHATQSAVAES